MSGSLSLIKEVIKMYKVLLVEDEEMIRKGLRYTFNWLEQDCVIIAEACNGQEALPIIAELNPDIVITDVNMPIMDGITMIERCIESVTCSFIILSGYDEFHMAKKAIHLGVTEYLLKPLEHDQLIAALERAKEQVELKRTYDLIKNKPEDEPLEVLGAGFMQGMTRTSRYVGQMLRYIEEHYPEKISMQDLVDLIGISGTYLNQKFKAETTFTFNDFLNRYRIQKAIDRLKDSDSKVYMIASDVGFKDYKYFINIFKKYAGCTPSQFQEYYQHKSQGE